MRIHTSRAQNNKDVTPFFAKMCFGNTYSNNNGVTPFYITLKLMASEAKTSP